MIAEGTADELKAQVGGHRVVITLVDGVDQDVARDVLQRHGAGPVRVTSPRDLDVAVEQGPAELQLVLGELSAGGVPPLHDAGMRRPTLDDVFLSLTGHGAVADTDTESEVA